MASPEHFVWAVDGSPVSVHLGADAVRALEPKLRSGSLDRPDEIGGFLLGRSRQVNDSWIVAVDDIEFAACEHARGPSWTLSRADRDAFDRHMRRLSDRQVVGWFRTHTRPGLYLDQHDFELFRDFFPHPAAIALIVRTDATAGFFFWENGYIERTRPFGTFTLQSEALRFSPEPGRHAAAPETSVPIRHGLRKELLWIPAAAGIALAMFWNPTLPFATRAEPPDATARAERPVFSPPPPPERKPGKSPLRETAAVAPASSSNTPQTSPPLQARTEAAPPVRSEIPPRAPQPKPETTPPPAPVIATVEPSKPNVLKRAVGSIPGLGFLKKPKTEELDSPATVARRVRPARFDDTSPVRVKVKIGTDGYVKSAHLLTTSTTAATAISVMRAAREWRFTPAKQANRPVESEMVLTFQPEHGGGSTL